MNIGEIIHNRRKELNLTLEDVGKAVGVGKGTVKKWETGAISNMGRDKIALLSKILKVNPLTFINEKLIIDNGVLNTISPFTDHETAVITAYRNKPELQPAVDKLLDVPAEKQELKLVGRDGKIRKGKEAEDYLREANEQAAKITDKPEDFGI